VLHRASPIIDDVLVTASSVPEPQTYWLVLTGIGLVGFGASKRRTALARVFSAQQFPRATGSLQRRHS
jgi:hypothetical protein